MVSLYWNLILESASEIWIKGSHFRILNWNYVKFSIIPLKSSNLLEERDDAAYHSEEQVIFILLTSGSTA